MPLIKSGSDKALQKNISKEIEAGKSQEQAVAIALDVQRKAKETKYSTWANSEPHKRRNRG